MKDVKFPSPSGDNGCLLGTLRALTTTRRLIGVVLYAAALAPLTDAFVNVLSFPR